jgi:hypothetical protein
MGSERMATTKSNRGRADPGVAPPDGALVGHEDIAVTPESGDKDAGDLQAG